MDADEPVKPQAQGGRPVLVWDLPTRMFHWLVVVMVVAAYATAKLNWMDWHVRIGEALLTLVLFRLLWGFFGSETARFHSFLRACRCMAASASLVPPRSRPAGGTQFRGRVDGIATAGFAAGETLSGLYVNNDVADDGPLTQWVPAAIANAITALHTILWDALLVAVALHVLAIAVYAVAKGHNLLHPMLTGVKRLPERIRAPRQASAMLALLLLVISATAVTLLATYL